MVSLHLALAYANELRVFLLNERILPLAIPSNGVKPVIFAEKHGIFLGFVVGFTIHLYRLLGSFLPFARDIFGSH
jgi:hypothetical protein